MWNSIGGNGGSQSSALGGLILAGAGALVLVLSSLMGHPILSGSDSSGSAAQANLEPKPAAGKPSCSLSGKLGTVKAATVKRGDDLKVTLSFNATKPIEQVTLTTQAGPEPMPVDPVAKKGRLPVRTIKGTTRATAATVSVLTVQGAEHHCDLVARP